MNIKKPLIIKNKWMLLTISALLSITSLAGCGHDRSPEDLTNTAYSTPAEFKDVSVSKQDAGAEYKYTFREPFEGIVLKNHRLRQCVYEQLGKEEDSPLYEEELSDYRGLLRESDHGSFSITNGQELDFVRTYFDLNSFYEFSVIFTPALYDWSIPQLEGLNDLQKPVRILGRKDTIPAEVLSFFTGTEKLTFYNIADVTGTFLPGRSFPDTVRDVSILSYNEPCAYTFENLITCMQDSNVEYLYVSRSSRINSGSPFPLDAVLSMKSLIRLNLRENSIEVKNKDCLSGSSLQYLTGFVIDGQTDTSVFELLPQLTKIDCSVTADADLSFVSENEDLSLRLLFCPENVEFSGDSVLYPDGEPAIFPELDEALGWRESEDDDNFLAIYQRIKDEGRTVESFSIRRKNKDYGTDHGYPYPIVNDRIFLRMTDGAHVQLLIPERSDPELIDFGDFRSDFMYLTDINFDGIKDITLDSGGFGNSQWSFEYGWIYDPDSGLYVPSDSYQNIINPSVDNEHELIRSAWRNNAASHGYAIFRYDEDTGNYYLERQMTESDVTYKASELMPDLEIPENGTLWEWTEIVYDKDDRSVVDERSYYAVTAPGLLTEYPDAYDCFQEPDSYWGN